MGPPTAEPLGSVLVVGGSGFVGFHIVRHFLKQPRTSVSAISRNPERKALPGISYHEGDVSDSSKIRDLVLAIHCPRSMPVTDNS